MYQTHKTHCYSHPDWKNIDKFIKIISNEEVGENDYNLSPSRYIGNGKEEEYRDVDEILAELAEIAGG
ncbi:unnamed protein product [marine sediment metagenome]|uniref:DNA methylase adenine-specific domain-containing protein n=1 Tax=marine sediment metagenome TaxID=412755 RepID=X1ATF7_9ZZZZ